MKQRAKLEFYQKIDLDKSGITIRGRGTNNKFACEVRITATGMACYKGRETGASWDWKQIYTNLVKNHK